MKIKFLCLLAALATPAFCVSADSVSTPEPSTIAMLAIGGAGLGLMAWRRSRKK